MTAIDLDKLRKLIALLTEQDVAEFEHEKGGEKVRIVRGALVHTAPVVAHVAPHHLSAHPPPLGHPAEPAAHGAHQAAASGASDGAAPDSAGNGVVDVTSPFVGTFYRAPSPDVPPFVDVGSVVRQGQTLCIIEAMKLMNEIEADHSGTIVEIFAQNGKSVEFGQRLFRIKKT
jgi:acetyl-CoA carboxylase biotin carboxyl carrier protein